MRVPVGLGVERRRRSDAKPVRPSELRTRQRRLRPHSLPRASRSAHHAPPSSNTGLADTAKENRLLDSGVMRVGSYGVEEVGAELQEAAELVGGGEGGERDSGGGGGDEGEVGAEETFVGDFGEEDEGVCRSEGGQRWPREWKRDLGDIQEKHCEQYKVSNSLPNGQRKQNSPRKRASRSPTSTSWPSPYQVSTSA